MYAQARDAASQPLHRWPDVIDMCWPPPQHIFPDPAPDPQPFYRRPPSGQYQALEYNARRQGKVVYQREIGSAPYVQVAGQYTGEFLWGKIVAGSY